MLTLLALMDAGPTPKNLSVVQVNGTAVQLAFELPAQLQYTDMISGYEVVHSSNGEAATTVFKEVAPPQIAKPQLTLTSLTPHTQYTLKVCIVAVCALESRDRRGPFSELINITTIEAGKILCYTCTHSMIVRHWIQRRYSNLCIG